MSYTNGLDKPTDYFETVTYSGNGTGQDITTLDFQPDWLWIKRRDSVGSHRIQDSIRGTTNYLQSDKTDAEASGGDVDAFLSNGFSLSGGATAYNVSGGTYVGWSWLGGGTASSNTDGSITSTVSANTTSGFSVVSYTGTGSNATVGHGLGSAPQVVIIKDRSVARDWIVGHTAIGFDKYLLLNSTTASITASNRFQDTAPSSSVVTIGTHGYVNNSGSNYIAYCFAEKKGFSKFGSYTGNGSTDGTFVYTGFKPAWIMFKRTDSANSWPIEDTKRDTFNPADKRVWAEATDGETENGNGLTDFLSNGFKIRQSTTQFNASGGSYIYMAFAENPFVTSGGIPTTAR